MSITKVSEFIGMKKVSDVVAYTLREMKTYARPGMTIETFISTHSSYAVTLRDGWTMVGNKGGYMAQHEHTIVVTDNKPIILTEKNEITLQ